MFSSMPLGILYGITIEFDEEVYYVLTNWFRRFFGRKKRLKRLFKIFFGLFWVISSDMSNNIRIGPVTRLLALKMIQASFCCIIYAVGT